MMDLDKFPVDDKGRKVLPDDLLETYYRECPDGTINESRTKLVSNGGLLSVLGANRDRDREIQSAGGKALNAKRVQRRTVREALDYILSQQIPLPQIVEAFGESLSEVLPEDASVVDLLGISAVQAALKGNAKALEYIRDSIGEKPVNEVSIDEERSLSDADRRLLEKVNARLMAQAEKEVPK